MLMKIYHRLRGELRNLLVVSRQVDDAKMMLAKLLISQIARQGLLTDIRQAEFKVFSQFGEDGILQYLIRQTGIQLHERSFVEFGVETYDEANTRFLLMNDNWRGLIIDGSASNIAKARLSPYFWRHDLSAVSAFIDRDNINRLIEEGGYDGPIGILSVDIDGNDYWVWEKIDIIDPVIVVAEYNSVFGADRAVTVPYDPSFFRTKAHPSNLYWGTSLKALALLAQKKGYALVGSNSAGNNAFFVKRTRLNGQPAMTVKDAYVESRFRESRDRAGRLTYLSGSARSREIADIPLWDVERNAPCTVRELFPVD